MKKIILGVFLIVSMGLSVNALANEKIVIQGTPTVLTQQGTTWIYSGTTLPTVSGDYYYLKTGDTTRVCRTSVIPTLSASAAPFDVIVGGTTTTLQCYDPVYFTITD